MTDEQMSAQAATIALREKRDRLIAEAEAAELLGDQRDVADFLADVKATANRHLQLFASTVCGGEMARIATCTDADADACALHGMPSCPRRIREHDAALEAIATEERLITVSGVPRALQTLVCGNMKPTDATIAVDTWLESGQTLLLLAGGVGIGKSVAAAYAIKRTPGRWFAAPDMPQLQGYERAREVDALMRPRLLVIDDLGAEYADRNEWARTQLRTLICKRHDEGARTVITTNLNAAAWKEYADARLIDRLGTGTVKTIGGASMRRKA